MSTLSRSLVKHRKAETPYKVARFLSRKETQPVDKLAPVNSDVIGPRQIQAPATIHGFELRGGLLGIVVYTRIYRYVSRRQEEKL